MMQFYASLNTHGVPQVVSTTQGDGMIEVPQGVDPLTHMCPSGAWEPRPAVQVAVMGNMVEVLDVPPGTALEVVDIEAGAILADTILDADETLHLPDAGSYQIDVRPPMPWLGWAGRITC